jgi:hypothetical protein
MIAINFDEKTKTPAGRVVADVRVRLSHLVSDGQSLAIIGCQLVQALEEEMDEEKVQVDGRTTCSTTMSTTAGMKKRIKLKQNFSQLFIVF